MAEYAAVDLKKKKSEVLIIQCADPRFQQAYRETIDGLGNYYDLMERAGASKGFVEDSGALAELQMLYGLHGFSEVHILDHVDCGAYGPLEDEVVEHTKCLKLAEEMIKKAVPQLKVVPHLLGEHSEISLEIA